MRVLIFGANGMLGKELQQELSEPLARFKVIPLSHQDLDITDLESIKRALKEEKPSLIINAAAKSDVDACQADIRETFATNSWGPERISSAIRDTPCTFIHMSTDQVFDGKKGGGHLETDKPHPINFYGESKYASEKKIRIILERSPVRWYVIRTSWLFSEFRNSFVDKIAVEGIGKLKRLVVAKDQFGAPTWAKRLAQHLLKLAISGKESGIYHFISEVKENEVSRLQIVEEVCNFFGKSVQDLDLRLEESEKLFKVPRGLNCVLKNTKFINLPYWRDDLREYLKLKYLSTGR